jgi:L-ectoine synthase
MQVRSVNEIAGTVREVPCPSRDICTSFRLLLASDGMGFSMHLTEVSKGEARHWHYKNHLEACYCVEGLGILTDLSDGREYKIKPGTMYALDKNDDHTFQAIKPTILVSVFNPPVTGGEIHDNEGSYNA